MFDNFLIRPDSLKNDYQNGEAVGFQFSVKIADYRGCFLSLHNGYYIECDGAVYSRDVQTFEVNGKGERTFDELKKCVWEHWDYGTEAIVHVKKPGGLEAGNHRIWLQQTILMQYGYALLPQLISMVIVAYIVFALLGNETGMINSMLKDPVNFYQEPKFWPFILVFVYIWKQVGYNSIIFLSAIVGIDRRLYEAAKVDGATKWQQIWFVTLPMLRSTIITLMLLQVGRIFYSDFGLFYQVPMDSGALYDVTNTVDTYVYRSLMVLNNVSIASAGSTYQAVVGFALVFCVNLVVRRLDRNNALF